MGLGELRAKLADLLQEFKDHDPEGKGTLPMGLIRELFERCGEFIATDDEVNPRSLSLRKGTKSSSAGSF